MVRWLNKPKIRNNISIRYPVTIAGEKKWLEKLPEKQNDVVLLLVLKGRTPKQDRPIGIMGIHGIDRENGTATTGAIIGEEECWGKGYGPEAKMAVLEYAFNTLNLYKVYSRVYDYNNQSMKYSEKCGYKQEATLPKDQFRLGRRVDVHVLAVYADAWRVLWEKTRNKYLPKKKK
jgi:RimJ/RimL family protein N-acetyltransferase